MKEDSFESLMVSITLCSLCDHNCALMQKDVYTQLLEPVEKFICLKGLSELEKRTRYTENFYSSKGFLRFLLYLNSSTVDRFNFPSHLKGNSSEDLWSELYTHSPPFINSLSSEKLTLYTSAIESNNSTVSQNICVEKTNGSEYSKNRRRNFMQI